jgi:nucleoid DNA-binding protein
MNTVNKRNLAQRIADNHPGITAKDANAVINAFIEEVQDAVASGERVAFARFGVFEPRHRAPRTARNPHTGEKVPVAARTVPTFQAADGFRQRVTDTATERMTQLVRYK